MRTIFVMLLVGCSVESGVPSDVSPLTPPDDMLHIPSAQSGDVVSAPFWIDRKAVSRDDYDRCVFAGKCSAEKGTFDLRVSWSKAVLFCRWRNARLPTNLELVLAEPSVASETEGWMWSGDVDPERPSRRLTQNLSPRPRGWYPPDLGADSMLAIESHQFRCARSTKPRPASRAFIPANPRAHCRMSDGGPCTPRRDVAPAFFLDVFEVTNAEYAACVEAGACRVSPHVFAREEPAVPALARKSEAIAYCEWRGARLPTMTEWDRAAVGDEDRLYPWGNQMLERCEDVTLPRCGTRIAVGSGNRDVTKHGVRDMFGSVDEWVAGPVERDAWRGFRCAHDLH